MLGSAFQPGRIEDEDRRQARLSPVQQAVQILSLRLPRVMGSAAPLDRSLLTSARAPHVNAVVESILQRVLGGGAPAPGMAPGTSQRRTRGLADEMGELLRSVPIGSQGAPRIGIEQPAPSPPRQARATPLPRPVGPALPPGSPGPGFGRPALQQEPALRSVVSGFSPF